jgi:hypothetical protein
METKHFLSRCALGLIALVILGPAHADGAATATVTISGSTVTYSGGSCVSDGETLVINLGVLPADAPKGTHPDFFGAVINKVPGHFDHALVTFNKDGKRNTTANASGEATTSSASFSGHVGGVPMSGSFKC